eukprot:c34024_g1_i1.p2 GENE.c34024_g1_i1~~c34024_g1_i1.p2  ORF type:complete len:195 (+),score=37.42 c34024_g1_i1:124-708(+)
MALHNAFHRANLVVSNAFMYLLGLMIVIWLVGLLESKPAPVFEAKVHELVLFAKERFHPIFLPPESAKKVGVERDVANMTLNIRADLRSVFQYNVKEVFAYVAFEWATKKHPVNQLVVWDAILLSPNDAVFELNGTAIEYLLTDVGHNFKGAHMTIVCAYNTIPYTGQMFWSSVSRTPFSMPLQYMHNPIQRHS